MLNFNDKFNKFMIDSFMVSSDHTRSAGSSLNVANDTISLSSEKHHIT